MSPPWICSEMRTRIVPGIVRSASGIRPHLYACKNDVTAIGIESIVAPTSLCFHGYTLSDVPKDMNKILPGQTVSCFLTRPTKWPLIAIQPHVLISSLVSRLNRLGAWLHVYQRWFQLQQLQQSHMSGSCLHTSTACHSFFKLPCVV